MNETHSGTGKHCGDCRSFGPAYVGNCEVVGYGTKAANTACDRFEPKKEGEIVSLNPDQQKRTLMQGVTLMLQALNLDIMDQHLKGTPERVARAWLTEFGSGYAFTEERIKELLSVDFLENSDEMVVVKDIPFISHCSHHMVPFSGIAKIGYVPNSKVVGLSKLARVLDAYALRLQIQERLTNQVAEAIMQYVSPHGVGVVIEASHYCMCYRGVKKPGSKMVTSCLLGRMREDAGMRQEFLNF